MKPSKPSSSRASSIVLAIGFGLLAFPASAQNRIATVDKPVAIASSFRIVTTDRPGQTVRLSDFARDKKTVVIVFLANRCGVTWLYADKIAALQKKYAANPNIALIGVHSNSEESDRELTDELKKRGMKITVIDDKPKQEIANYFGAKVTPYFIVIDGKGVLRYKGPFDKMGGSYEESKRPQYLQPALGAVLTGKPVALKSVRALGCEITPR
ncbi:MAG: redoxin domain-containing protein [Fibrella sp.]|nr:redoxin domain-containing protein [Armatimonadota bacterium]